MSFGTRAARPGSGSAFLGQPLFFDESFGGHFECAETRYFSHSGGLRDFLTRKKLLPKTYLVRSSGLERVLARLNEPSMAEFEADFKQISERFESGVMSKIVPAIFERTGLSSIEEEVLDQLLLESFLSFFENLAADFKSKLFLYAFWDEKRFHVGLTPEYLFFKEKNSPLHTMALAGSAPITRDDADFSTDLKELTEHAFVVEDIRSKCLQMGVANVATSKLSILKLPAIKHLFTRVEIAESELKTPFDAWAWLKNLHPTSALGVQPPTPENKKFFRALQSAELRGSLGSPLTLSDPARGLHFSVVSIRGVERRGNQFFLGAGCGVVRASDPLKEWQELSLKRESVKKILLNRESKGSGT